MTLARTRAFWLRKPRREGCVDGCVVRAVNGAIKAFLKEQPRAHFIDVFPKMLGADGLPLPDIFREDRLHMNLEGYRIWRDVVGPYLPRADKP